MILLLIGSSSATRTLRGSESVVEGTVVGGADDAGADDAGPEEGACDVSAIDETLGKYELSSLVGSMGGDPRLAKCCDIRRAPIGTPESVIFSRPGGGGLTSGCNMSGGVCVTEDRLECGSCIVNDRFTADGDARGG